MFLNNPVCSGKIGLSASLSCTLTQDKLRITVSLAQVNRRVLADNYEILVEGFTNSAST